MLEHQSSCLSLLNLSGLLWCMKEGGEQGLDSVESIGTVSSGTVSQRR